MEKNDSDMEYFLNDNKFNEKEHNKMLNKLLIKYQQKVQEQINISQQYMEKLKPPILHYSFAQWRAHYYKEFSQKIQRLPFKKQIQWKRKFAQTFRKLLDLYTNEMRKAYVIDIQKDQFNIPENYKEKIEGFEGNSNLENEMALFSKVLAEWSVQIEQAEDIIHESILYGFLKKEDNLDHLLETELNKATQLQSKEKLSFGVKGMSKKLMCYVLSMVKSKMIGMAKKKAFTFTNISWGSSMVILYTILGNSYVPWSLIITSFQIPYIIGGYIAPTVVDKLYNWILKSKYIGNEIVFLRESFELMNTKLRDFIKDLQVTFDEILKLETEKEVDYMAEIFQTKINQLIKSKFDPEEIKVELSKEELEIQELIQQTCIQPELESWAVVEKVQKQEEKEISQEEIEQSFTLMGFNLGKFKNHSKDKKDK